MPDSTRALSVRSPGEPEATSFGELVWGTANECGLRIPAEVSLFWRQTLFASFQAELVESTSVANSAPDGTEPDNSSRPVSSTLCCDDVFPHQAVNSTPELSGGGNSPLLPVRNQRDGGAPFDHGNGNSPDPTIRKLCDSPIPTSESGNTPSLPTIAGLTPHRSSLAIPALTAAAARLRGSVLPPLGNDRTCYDRLLAYSGARALKRADACRTPTSTSFYPDRGLPSVIEPVSATSTSASVVQFLPEWWPYRHSRARNATQADVVIAAGAEAPGPRAHRDDGMVKVGASPDCRVMPHPCVSPANSCIDQDTAEALEERRRIWLEVTSTPDAARVRAGLQSMQTLEKLAPLRDVDYVRAALASVRALRDESQARKDRALGLNRDLGEAAPALGKRAYEKTLYDLRG